jgi:hypothetical protein
MLAAIIFVASMVIPAAKVLSLGWLLIAAQSRSTRNPCCARASTAHPLHRALVDGRHLRRAPCWSAWCSSSSWPPVEPGRARCYFAAVVVLTMLASSSFDPRLIWDPLERSRERYRGDPPGGRAQARLALVAAGVADPICAAIIGGWLAFKAVWDRGPTITIQFLTGEGIEANKTRIKYKAVNIGTVTAVRLAPDHKSVVVTATIDRHTSTASSWRTRASGW